MVEDSANGSQVNIHLEVVEAASENTKLRGDLKNLKEAFNDVLTHNRKLRGGPGPGCCPGVESGSYYEAQD